MKQEKMQVLEGEGGIITRALDLAAIKHEGKYRKNPEAQVPYIVHPVSEADLGKGVALRLDFLLLRRRNSRSV